MGFFKRPFGKKEKKTFEFDSEKLVRGIIYGLSPCSRYVVIASPRYDSRNNSCDFVMHPHELLRWLEVQIEAEEYARDEVECATAEAMIIWLRNADCSNDNFTYITEDLIFEILDPKGDEFEFFIKNYNASIYCIKCGYFVEAVYAGKREVLMPFYHGPGYSHSSNEDVWDCQEGHQLYFVEESFVL